MSDRPGSFLAKAVLNGSTTTVFTEDGEVRTLDREQMIHELYAYGLSIKIATYGEVSDSLQMIADTVGIITDDKSAIRAVNLAISGAVKGLDMVRAELRKRLDDGEF